MQVWVEKYRPKRLDDIIGQEMVIKGLKSYVISKNIPHLMFAGPPGIGKTASAISLVRELFGDLWHDNFMELNASVSKDTPVLVKINGTIERTNFEKLDKIFFVRDENVKDNIKDTENIEVLSINKDMKMVWKKVSKIIRHKTDKILRVYFEGGKIELTGNHSVVEFDLERNLISKSAKDLKEGDYLISLVTNLNCENDDNMLFINKDQDLSWVYGAFTAEGCLGNNHLMWDSHEKEYTGDLHSAKIKKIEIKKIEIVNYNDYVYDFSVPGSEMFFAGNVPILLHNSDERGIEIVREKIKNFARSSTIGDAEFKILFLDEADALTPEAQAALRRTMERHTDVCRFILSCNYSSKIIEPIQSRCAIYKFGHLSDSAIIERIYYIANKENLEMSASAINAIKYVAQGDMRRAINALQSASMIDKKIDVEMIYKTVAMAKPEDITDLILLSLEGNFLKAHAKLDYLLDNQGLAGEDITTQIYREIFNINIPDRLKVQLIDYVGEINFRISEGANQKVQLGSLISKFMLYGINRN